MDLLCISKKEEEEYELSLSQCKVKVTLLDFPWVHLESDPHNGGLDPYGVILDLLCFSLRS
jgi:hypothetical protein